MKVYNLEHEKLLRCYESLPLTKPNKSEDCWSWSLFRPKNNKRGVYFTARDWEKFIIYTSIRVKDL